MSNDDIYPNPTLTFYSCLYCRYKKSIGKVRIWKSLPKECPHCKNKKVFVDFQMSYKDSEIADRRKVKAQSILTEKMMNVHPTSEGGRTRILFNAEGLVQERFKDGGYGDWITSTLKDTRIPTSEDIRKAELDYQNLWNKDDHKVEDKEESNLEIFQRYRRYFPRLSAGELVEKIKGYHPDRNFPTPK